jgi:hypothetical protein
VSAPTAMTPELLRAVIAWLEGRVRCEGGPGAIAVSFAAPSDRDLVALGVSSPDAVRLLAADWWPEMVAEIVDTPSFCGADEPPETVLRYARDVIGEYIGKRFTP